MYSGDVFPHAGGRVFIHVIQHLSLYISLWLCFFSKGALLGKGNPHRTLGWLLGGQPVFLRKKNGLSGDNPFFYKKKRAVPGVGRTTRFFTKKKRAVKPFFKKNGLLTRFFGKKTG